MRRRVSLVLAVIFLPLLVPATAWAADDPAGAWVDTPAAAELVVGKSVILHGHSRGSAASGVKYTQLSFLDYNHYIVVASAGQVDWTYRLDLADWLAGTVSVATRVYLDDGTMSPSTVVKLQVSNPDTPAVTCPCRFEPQPTGSTGLYSEHVSRELGLRFFVDRPGSVTGLRLSDSLKPAPGVVAHLWNADGKLLATSEDQGTFPTFTFASPVAVRAYTPYVVSYTSPVQTPYLATPGMFQARMTIPPFTADYHTWDGFPYGAPGVFGDGGRFPTDTYNGTNYWVSPVFTTG